MVVEPVGDGWCTEPLVGRIDPIGSDPPHHSPRAALRSIPAMTRSMMVARSNSANTPSIWTIIPGGRSWSRSTTATRGAGSEQLAEEVMVIGPTTIRPSELRGVRGVEPRHRAGRARALQAERSHDPRRAARTGSWTVWSQLAWAKGGYGGCNRTPIDRGTGKGQQEVCAQAPAVCGLAGRSGIGGTHGTAPEDR